MRGRLERHQAETAPFFFLGTFVNPRPAQSPVTSHECDSFRVPLRTFEKTAEEPTLLGRGLRFLHTVPW
jgi:hypothetical protein